MSDELLPCPFCGDESPTLYGDGARPDDGYRLVCCTALCCGVETGWHSTASEAITAWNSLAKADAILARQGPGPGEAVAWRWRHTAAVYGDVSTTPGPWKDGHPPKHSAAEAWKYEVQKLVAIAATPTGEA